LLLDVIQHIFLDLLESGNLDKEKINKWLIKQQPWQQNSGSKELI